MPDHWHQPDTELIGSLLEGLPVLTYIQSKFDIDSACSWLRSHIYDVAMVANCVYVILIWIGLKWMSDKPPFKLHRPLVLWNFGLAVFSVLGTVSILPHLLHFIVKYGLHNSMCHSDMLLDPHIAVWGFIFVLSKPIEYGDTMFLVLRKRPLMFLHWYHHVTASLYAWYAFGNATSTSAIVVWFGAMNYTVHSVMYSYYSLKAARIQVPSSVAQMITVLQIAQMFIALYVIVTNFVLSRKYGNEICECHEEVFKLGLVVYGSYAILFLKFFYERYC